MKASIDLNEEQTAIIRDAQTIYPHVNKRAFYRACMVEGAESMRRARAADCPIPLEDLFSLETPGAKTASAKARGIAGKKGARRPKQIDLVEEARRIK